jgi:hypothetical protein
MGIKGGVPMRSLRVIADAFLNQVEKTAALAGDLRKTGEAGVKRPPFPTEDAKQMAYSQLKSARNVAKFKNENTVDVMDKLGFLQHLKKHAEATTPERDEYKSTKNDVVPPILSCPIHVVKSTEDEIERSYSEARSYLKALFPEAAAKRREEKNLLHDLFATYVEPPSLIKG